MAQGYYTLTEASQFLGMPVDELKQMAQKGQIRSFQDRGTLRFRIQDIQELARKRGVSTDPELVLGDASLPMPKSSSSPRSGLKKKSAISPKTPAKAEGVPEVFDFDIDESVDLGADLPGPSSGSKSKPSSKGKRPSTPKIGSDSDVRLVADGSDVTFSVPKEASAAGKPTDSDVKISPDPLKPRTGIHSGASSVKRASQLALAPAPRSESPPPGPGIPRHAPATLPSRSTAAFASSPSTTTAMSSCSALPTTCPSADPVNLPTPTATSGSKKSSSPRRFRRRRPAPHRGDQPRRGNPQKARRGKRQTRHQAES